MPVGLLMIGGEFDLSAGVMTGVTAIVMALLVGKWHVNTWIAILITLAFAIAIGLINGYIVTLTKLPSFIVTLATFFVLRGASTGGVLLLNSGSTQITVTQAHPAGPQQREVGIRLLVLLERIASQRLLDGDSVVHRR